MKDNANILSFTCFFVFIFLISLMAAPPVLAKVYRPEITGSIENGDKLYTDPGDWENDEPLDYYRYNKQWLKYKQKLAVGEYYYLKLQRQEKIYDQSQSYNSLNWETEGNYTFYLNQKLRNRFKLLLRDKDYLEDTYQYKDYQLARLQYTLQYEYNEVHDYELIFQKQWTEYESRSDFDYQRDRIALKWGWKVNPDLDLDTKVQYDWQHNDDQSSRSDQEGRKISLNFKYKL